MSSDVYSVSEIVGSSTDSIEEAIENAVDLGKTLFIVSSKSGSTLEPNIFMSYFLDRVRTLRGKDKASEQFVAVTDPGSALERQAKELGFAHIFHGVPSIGGRYSVLSKFGLVPAAVEAPDKTTSAILTYLGFNVTKLSPATKY